jgi:hypothetical protein
VVSFTPRLFTPGERAPGTHWIGDWVDPRAGLDDVEKRKFLILPGLELRPLGRPVRSQSLYRLRYPGSYLYQSTIHILSLEESTKSRSQWPRGLRHEPSSPAQTLGSWVRIPLEAWMSACVYSVFVLFYV